MHTPSKQPTPRDQAIKTYLKNTQWHAATCTPLAMDASFRRYFRLQQNGQQCILMDAPAPWENLTQFVRVAEHLQALGLRPPHIYHHDLDAGFALLEDLGNQTFTQLLNQGTQEYPLYQLATHTLLSLQTHPKSTALSLPHYDTDTLLKETQIFLDWYYPHIIGQQPSTAARNQWSAIWRALLDAMPVLPATLVLRDFHVDNAMLIPEQAHNVCALLDFQDALIGAPAYDLVSILEDARRDVSASTYQACYQQYLHQRTDLNADAFAAQYRLLAVQRHIKVLGIFLRLAKRDQKTGYLVHIPRLKRLLHNHLAHPDLVALQQWFTTHNIHFHA